MAGFIFILELADGTPADPLEHHTAVPNWRADDTIPLGRERMLRVVEKRLEEGSEGEPVSVLVVESV